MDKLTRAMVADRVIDRVAAELAATTERLACHEPAGTPGAVDRAADDGADGPDPGRPIDATQPPDVALAAPRDGYVPVIDHDALLAATAEARAVLCLTVHPGDWANAGATIGRAHPAAKHGAPAPAMREAIVWGPARTPTQDVEFELQRMVEGALRALSPGINDAFTAIVAIDNLGAALVRLSARRLEPARLRDAQGIVRLVRPVPGWARPRRGRRPPRLG